MKKLIYVFLLILFLNLEAYSQEVSDNMPKIEMADSLRSNGKIFVVVVGVIVIFSGLLTYLIITDKKVKRLEKEMEALIQSKKDRTK